VASIALFTGWAFSDIAAAQSIAISSSRDTSIYEESLNSNGVGNEIFIGNNNGGNARRGLVFFDVAAFVPAGATIDSVELQYNAPKNQVAAGNTVSIHRALADWGEASSSGTGRGAPAQPGDASWQDAFVGSTTWTNPGGDFAAVASDSFVVTGTGSGSAMLSGLETDIQFFLDNPTQNFGFFLIGDEVNNQTAMTLNSREAAITADRPSLLVTFTAAVPEPGCGLVLLAAGTAVVFRRRRSV
jgi:hypothetical protein